MGSSSVAVYYILWLCLSTLQRPELITCQPATHPDERWHVPRSVIYTNTFKYVVILSHVCDSLIMIYVEHSAAGVDCNPTTVCFKIFIISQHFLTYTEHLHTSAHFSITQNHWCTLWFVVQLLRSNCCNQPCPNTHVQYISLPTWFVLIRWFFNDPWGESLSIFQCLLQWCTVRPTTGGHKCHMNANTAPCGSPVVICRSFPVQTVCNWNECDLGGENRWGERPVGWFFLKNIKWSFNQMSSHFTTFTALCYQSPLWVNLGVYFWCVTVCYWEWSQQTGWYFYDLKPQQTTW